MVTGRVQKHLRLALLLLACCPGSQTWASSFADQEAEEPGENAKTHEAEPGEEEKKNEIAVFIGSTEGEVEDGEKKDRDFTIGLDYERRLTQRVGIGGLYDWVAEGNREFLIGVPVFLHPGKTATLQVAPCVQRIREDKETNFVLRLGFSWGFDVGKMRIAPEILYDIAEGQDFVVFGVAFGKEF